MALNNCHECDNQVSDSARACPKCGAPVMVRIRRELKARLIMSALGIVFAVIAGFVVWLNQSIT